MMNKKKDQKLFLLVKAQVLRETMSYYDYMDDVDDDYVNYLKNSEVSLLEAMTTEEQLDEYLRMSRRLTLDEWFRSLDWSHCK